MSESVIPGLPDDVETLPQVPAANTWYEAVDIIRAHIVQISTPRGQGTGFLVSQSEKLCAIATAAHVIDQAHYWEEPIRITHLTSGNTTLLRKDDRAIFLHEDQDTAALLIRRGAISFPDFVLPITPKETHLRVGNDIGWLGFPAVARGQLCFFGGRISAYDSVGQHYLVDGVAINGVSGGPAFSITPSVPPRVIGVVSAYIANRSTGETLPGLSVVRDVVQFHSTAEMFASLDQAKDQESPATIPPTTPEESNGQTNTRRPS